jgi:hypothetical protein
MSTQYPSCSVARKDLQDTQEDVGCYVWNSIDIMPTGDALLADLMARFPETEAGDRGLQIEANNASCLYNMASFDVGGYCERYIPREDDLLEIMKENLRIIEKERERRGLEKDDDIGASSSSQIMTIIGVSVVILGLVCLAAFVRSKNNETPSLISAVKGVKPPLLGKGYNADAVRKKNN